MENLGRIIVEHPLEPYYNGEANQFFLIRRGEVALEVLTPKHPPLMMGNVDEGGVLKWSWVVPAYRRHLDTCAAEPVPASDSSERAPYLRHPSASNPLSKRRYLP